MYSNESEGTDECFYDEFKLKKPFVCDVFFKINQRFKGYVSMTQCLFTSSQSYGSGGVPCLGYL